MLKVNATAYFLEQYPYEVSKDKDGNDLRVPVTRHAVSFLVYDEEEQRIDLIRSYGLEAPISPDKPLHFMDKCDITASITSANKDNQRRLVFESFNKIIEPSRIVKA